MNSRSEMETISIKDRLRYVSLINIFSTAGNLYRRHIVFHCFSSLSIQRSPTITKWYKHMFFGWIYLFYFIKEIDLELEWILKKSWLNIHAKYSTSKTKKMTLFIQVQGNAGTWKRILIICLIKNYKVKSCSKSYCSW